MKTKTILTAGCLLLSTVCTQAQQTTEPKRERAVVETQGDSIIILRGKGDMRIRLYEQQIEDDEQKEVEIFEGVYLEKVDADSRTFLDALPFIPKKKKYNEYEAHVSGVFLGFSRLADNFMGFGSSSKAHLDLSQSWELSVTIMGIWVQPPGRLSQLQEKPALGCQHRPELGLPFVQLRRRPCLVETGRKQLLPERAGHATRR